MDKTEPTLARGHAELSSELDWDDRARELLDTLVDEQPVLIRISLAKRIRDAAERGARQRGDALVTAEHVNQSKLEVAGK